MSDSAARTIDHVVMPVADLAAARRLLDGLGFTVAPDAAHPFGTGNACVFLADGTYLEPLAVLDRDRAEDAAAAGNTFLRRDVAYRLRHPLPAFTGVALRSDDAAGDAQRFAAAGFAGGELLEFGRDFEEPGGGTVRRDFRLGFAADGAAAETFVFACERRSGGAPAPGALAAHANGATGLSRLVFASGEPEAARAFLNATLGGDSLVANGLGFSFTVANAAIDVLTPDGLTARYGIPDRGRPGLRLVGVVLAVPATEPLASRAREAGLVAIEVLGRLVVPLAAVSGAFLAFERGT